MSELSENVLAHIARCDQTFDHYHDHEFAYQQMRHLALELLDEYEERLDDIARLYKVVHQVARGVGLEEGKDFDSLEGEQV